MVAMSAKRLIFVELGKLNDMLGYKNPKEWKNLPFMSHFKSPPPSEIISSEKYTPLKRILNMYHDYIM